jgi:hypothetical protein
LLPPLVNTRFQVLFHSPPGVLFTFPSRYLSAIGRKWVFSLGRWSSLLPTGLAWPVVLWMCLPPYGFSIQGCHFLWPRFPAVFCYPSCSTVPYRRLAMTLLNPIHATATAYTHAWFGLFPVRSPLLGESIFLSFPRVT